LTDVIAGTFFLSSRRRHTCFSRDCSSDVCSSDLITAAAVADDADCFGAATGQVTLTVSGGTAPYTYLWSNGATTQNLTDVIAGRSEERRVGNKRCTQTAPATYNEPASATRRAAGA